MEDSTDLKASDRGGESSLSERLAPWIALAALLISVGHITFAVWRDHINDDMGLLGM